MIKVNKELDLCSVLQSDIMNHNHCPLGAGDLLLEAKGEFIYNTRILLFIDY